MSDEAEVKGELRRSWVAHGFTQELARAQDGHVAQCMDALRGACRTTSDPKVAAAFATLVAAEALSLTFRKAGVK